MRGQSIGAIQKSNNLDCMANKRRNGTNMTLLSCDSLEVPLFNENVLIIAATRKQEPKDDEETIRRKMRRLTDNYDIHKEIGR